ncbi:MAG: ABC transporter ATP-binding protein [Gammaproteobacteria bacterium TMED92]|nr:MAG: ABC transporter ATP-binding protein [Gammaproteobacteria bacterium TMED92]
MSSEWVLNARGLYKSFYQSGAEVAVLKGADLRVAAGEQVAIVGRSGSGKSSLLHILAGLDSADQGIVEVAGSSMSFADADARARIRRLHMGFVYQQHHLLAEFTALENVAIPQRLLGVTDRQAQHAATALLEQVGLADRLQHLPAELSGGERQRVAVARSLVNKPKVVLTDEPTGSLDHDSAEQLMSLLSELSRQQNTAFVVVTHDLSMLKRFDRVARLDRGVLEPA